MRNWSVDEKQGKTILSKNQRDILHALGQESLIRDSFYLTGGTALSEYYLHHRLSEDLDFFSEQDVERGREL